MLGRLKPLPSLRMRGIAASPGPAPARPIAPFGAWGHRVALLALCAPYLQGGLQKCFDFPGAVAEMHHFGLHPAAGMAAAVIALELGGSAMVLSGFLRRPAALGLALFTVAATFLANRYWELADPLRLPMANAFYEHIGLAGALLLVAWHDRRQAGCAPRESL